MKKNLFLAFFAVFTTLFMGCTEEPIDEKITISTDEIIFEANKNLTQEVSVTANIDWSVTFKNETDAQWIRVTPENGSNDNKISITLTENKGEAREAIITIGSGSTVEDLKISQKVSKYNIIDFEDVELDPITNYSYGIYTNEDAESGEKIYSHTKFNTSLKTFYKESWGSWCGVAYSSNTDMETGGYANQYSVYYKDAITGNGGANGSKKFAVMYYANSAPGLEPAISFPEGSTKIIDNLEINNSTQAALSILNGDSFAKKFENGDWFKVTMTGYDNSNNVIKAIDFYLADYRDGKTNVIKEWTNVSLAELGEVNKVVFTLSSSDNGEFGMNTPAYLCVDNIAVRK